MGREMIRAWLVPTAFLLGSSLMTIGWFLGTTKWPSDLQRLLPLRVIDPAPIAEPCPTRTMTIKTSGKTPDAPVAFTNQVLATLAACDPNRQHTLRIHSTFRPSQVFVAGFPSESELNADRRLRSLIKKLSGQGYRPSQIERFHFQSAQNGLSIKISAEPN